MRRINGKSFDVRFMGIQMHVESFTLTIEDNSTVAKNKGIPNGYVEGDVSASGDIEIDTATFMKLSAAALTAGSWRDLKTFTIDAYAIGENSISAEAISVRAFDCKLRISDLLSIDPNTTDKTTHKLTFDVTGPDFVWINGTPYLRNSEFRLL